MKTFIYCTNSQSLRQLPENYLLAERVGSRWVCEPDAAVSPEIAMLCFEIIFNNHDIKWGHPELLLTEFQSKAEKLENIHTNRNISEFGECDG